ncbi:MAG: response regulator transcription factor [Burkholderiales bacterium]|nr:response regulator transcription factor [Burkholderiales bacterium]
MRILLVEDDMMLAEAVMRALTQSAHSVDCARDGAEADRALATEKYDLVLLDVGLPQIDGFEVLRRLRARRSTVPVLMLTVNDALEDLVTGLDLGADDYLTKPFRLSELEARVRALIRRAHSSAGSSDLVHGRLRLDMAGRRLYLDDQPMDLSLRELAVIELLLLREGKVVTKQQIVDHLYGWEDVSSSNVVEVFIHRLRKKLESSGVTITTVRGMGYLIEKPSGSGGD